MANNIKMKDLGLGSNYKGISFDAWGGIENFLRETSSGASGTAKPQLLRRVLPWLAKATNMTAQAVADLPFIITDEAGNEFDNSTKWKNKLGGMPNPSQLMYNLAASLCLGKAYVIPEYTPRQIVEMHYCAPHTVVPLITVNGLQDFSRTSDWGQSGKYFPLNKNEGDVPEGYTGEMMYFWLTDSDVEIGPAKSYPAGVALLACELATSMDGTLQTVSERGFVPPTLLAVKGMTAQGEREKTEAWYNRFLRRWSETVAKIINAETMDIKTIGAGMADLKGIYIELKRQAIEDIAAAFGIPPAIFMSDMAFATEVNPMIKVWYSTSQFKAVYQTIEHTFNDQLYPLIAGGKYHLKFQPDTLDAFQEDESKRAGAFREYVSARMRPSIAGEMLGLDLPEGIEYSALDELFDKDLADKPVSPINDPGAPPNQVVEKPATGAVIPANPADVIPPMKMTAEVIKELHTWTQLASRSFKRGESASDFKCLVIPDGIASTIRLKLRTAQNEAEILKAFEIGGDPALSDIRELAMAINRAVESDTVR